jgi:predicted transglutaminase-like cysteine proteinase
MVEVFLVTSSLAGYLYCAGAKAVDSNGRSIVTHLTGISLHLTSRAIIGGLLLVSLLPVPAFAFPGDLFGFSQTRQGNIRVFAQWIQVLERHLLEDIPEGSCQEKKINNCHLSEWRKFIDSIRTLPRDRQLERVNQYANHRRYVLDIENYGVEDYWAVAREFLYAGGDCEDYAITKLFSLRWLNYPTDDARIVILQDTNLRIPHAVLAVSRGQDIAILDNQTSQIVSHNDIAHYRPVYSVNENSWWLHLPK